FPTRRSSDLRPHHLLRLHAGGGHGQRPPGLLLPVPGTGWHRRGCGRGSREGCGLGCGRGCGRGCGLGCGLGQGRGYRVARPGKTLSGRRRAARPWTKTRRWTGMTDAFGDTGRHRGSDLAVADGDAPRFPSLWPAFYSPWQVFSEFLPRQWRGGPSVEVSAEGDDLVVRVEAPGVKPEDLNVWITEDSVTVEGERRSQRRSEHRGYYHSERQYGAFRRT